LDVAAICVVLVSLLIVDSRNFVYFDVTPKVVGVLFGGVLVCLAAFCPSDGAATPTFGAPSLLTFLFLLFFAIQVACTVTAENPQVALGGGEWRRMGLLTRGAALLIAASFAVWAAKRMENFELLRGLLCAFAAVEATYAVLQMTGWDPFLNIDAYRDSYSGALRPPGTLGSALFLAATLLPLHFLCLDALQSQKRWIRVAAFLGMTTTPLAILVSGTRSALLLLLVGWIWNWRYRWSTSKRTLPSLATAIALAGGLLFIPSAREGFLGRVSQSMSDWYGGTRYWLWMDTFWMALETPFLGFGPESFSRRFPQFAGEELSSRYPDHYHESPHNVLLEAWIESGVIGLGALVCIVAFGVWLWWRQRSHPGVAVLGLAVVAGWLNHLFLSLTLPTFVMLMLLTGLLAARSDWSQPAWTSWNGKLADCRPLLGVAAIGFALASYGLLAREFSYRRASEHAPPKEQMLAGASMELWESRRLLKQAAAETDAEVAKRLLGVAVEKAESSAQSSDFPAVDYLHLAVVHASAGDSRQVERTLRSAIQASPNWYQPHLLLARLMTAQGKVGEAIEEQAKAVKLGYKRDQRGREK
jgi:O-antigen ligase